MDLSVKDIFALRREGKIEEAYNAIRPMYAVHHGKYTTLCMFWCGVDMCMLYLQQVVDDSSSSRHAWDESQKIFMALQRMYPQVHEYERFEQSVISSSRQALDNLQPLMQVAQIKLGIQ